MTPDSNIHMVNQPLGGGLLKNIEGFLLEWVTTYCMSSHS